MDCENHDWCWKSTEELEDGHRLQRKICRACGRKEGYVDDSESYAVFYDEYSEIESRFA